MRLFPDKNAELSISYDRNSVTVRLYSENVYEYYKECKKKHKLLYSEDYVEMPVGTVTPDGYYYSMRGRQSVKDYVAGEGTLTPEMFLKLLLRTADVADLASNVGVMLSDIVFDYNCVFVQNGGKDFLFIYMPGVSLSADNPSAGMLLGVVFINMDFETLPQDMYSRFRSSVDALAYITDPKLFAESARILADELQTYLEDNQGLAKRIIRRLSGSSSPKKKERTGLASNEDQSILTAVVKAENGERMVVLKKIFNNDGQLRIRVGRDAEWADLKLDDIFVSRQHAELLIENGKEVHVKDFSLNGTYIGGEKTTENGVYGFSDGKMQIFVGENCEVELRVEQKSA